MPADAVGVRTLLLLGGQEGTRRVLITPANKIVCTESWPVVELDADQAIPMALCWEKQRARGFGVPPCRDVAGCGQSGSAPLLIALALLSLLRRQRT